MTQLAQYRKKLDSINSSIMALDELHEFTPVQQNKYDALIESASEYEQMIAEIKANCQ